MPLPPPPGGSPPQLRRAKIRYNAGIVPTYALCSIDNGTLLVSLCCLTGISTRVAYFDFVDGIDNPKIGTVLYLPTSVHIISWRLIIMYALPSPLLTEDDESRADRIDRADRADRAERTEKTEKTEKTENRSGYCTLLVF